jgi:hypothetical protein
MIMVMTMIVVVIVFSADGRNVGRQGHPIDEYEYVNIGDVRIREAGHEAFGRDEVVVARDEQEVVVRSVAVADRHDSQALPLLVKVVLVVGIAIMQTEPVELGIVIDVEKDLALDRA